MTNKLYTSGTVVDSGSLNDFNTSAYNFLSAIAGTADNITAVGPLSMLSYVTGQKFFFTPTGTNTTNATININGLGGRAITKFGNTLLIAGDLVTGKVAEIVYDGVGFQLINPQTFNLTNTVPAANLTGTVAIANGGTAATTAEQALINLGATGRLINVRSFTANTTYTPTAGTTRIVVEAVGGGGGGGGAPVSPGGQCNVGAGGGAGGYIRSIYTSAFSGLPIVIGNGGTGVSGAAGQTGGATSLGALFTCSGGIGGGSSSSSTIPSASAGTGGAASGGNIITRNGATSAPAVGSVASGYVSGSRGADSPFGGGGAPAIGVSGAASSAAGSPGNGYGAGGGGASEAQAGSAATGGAGSPGLMIIYEYS